MADTDEIIEQRIKRAIQDKADSLQLYGHGSTKKFLPRTLLDIHGLRHLDLSYFNFELPGWLTDITSLESLEITETESVAQIVPLVWRLEHLRKLKLAFNWNEMKELPASWEKLKHLEELNLDAADFKKFPAVISSLTSLESFSLHYCEIELAEVFDALARLPQLKKLRLMYNSAEPEHFLPESFHRLHAIEELHFNAWPCLRELPERIGEMHNLRVINLGNSDHYIGDRALMSELPESLCSLPNLEELDLYGLQDLKRLPSGFSRLLRLDIMKSGIDELQLSPEQWNNLEFLRMHGSLPDLDQAGNLKRFSVTI